MAICLSLIFGNARCACGEDGKQHHHHCLCIAKGSSGCLTSRNQNGAPKEILSCPFECQERAQQNPAGNFTISDALEQDMGGPGSGDSKHGPCCKLQCRENGIFECQLKAAMQLLSPCCLEAFAVSLCFAVRADNELQSSVACYFK